ncbi:hypothetical protein [Halobacillus sp. KGW1]|nr:hypothetical protein [Halobacillus sp. KGW1]
MAKKGQTKKKSPLVLVNERFGTIPAKEAFEKALAPYFDHNNTIEKLMK